MNNSEENFFPELCAALYIVYMINLRRHDDLAPGICAVLHFAVIASGTAHYLRQTMFHIRRISPVQYTPVFKSASHYTDRFLRSFLLSKLIVTVVIDPRALETLTYASHLLTTGAAVSL
jgi:hypothetical protein